MIYKRYKIKYNIVISTKTIDGDRIYREEEQLCDLYRIIFAKSKKDAMNKLKESYDSLTEKSHTETRYIGLLIIDVY